MLCVSLTLEASLLQGWLGEIQCQTVLAWQAVFSGWSVNVGDIRYPGHPQQKGANGLLVLNATEAAAHRAMSAQLFVAGSVLGWFGSSVGWENSLGLSDEDTAYTRLLASTKVKQSKYLVYGRLWRQPEWAAPPEMMNLHDYGYMEHNWNQSCPTPKVLAECWLADDGTFAVVATNHAETELVLNVTVDISEAGSTTPRLVRLTKAMPPRSVAVLPVDAAATYSQRPRKHDDEHEGKIVFHPPSLIYGSLC